MRNEALAKVLCHNICCIIQSVYELGVAATFWDSAVIEETRAMVEPEKSIPEDDLDFWAWV